MKLPKNISQSLAGAAMLISAVLSAGGCTKVETNCTYIFQPKVQYTKSGDSVALENVVFHAFYADTSVWEVASYEDAEAGIITDKVTRATRTADFSSHTGTMDGTLELGAVSSGPIMVVACDKNLHEPFGSRIYGWNQFEVPENLNEIRVSILFTPWNTEPRYTGGSKWTMVNGNPWVPRCSFTIKPYLQISEKGLTAPVTEGIRVFAHINVAAWQVSDYEDSREGLLKSREEGNDNKRPPDETAVYDGNGGWKLNAIEGKDVKVFILVCDESPHGQFGSKIYGWKSVDIPSDRAEMDIGVVLRPWRDDVKYNDDGWEMLDDGNIVVTEP